MFNGDAIDSLVTINKSYCEKEKEIKYMKILEIYEEYQRIRIKKESEKQLKEIEEKSAEYKIAKKYCKKANEELKKVIPELNNKEIDLISYCPRYSKETILKNEEVFKNEDIEMIRIDKKIKEIKVLLEMAENYEQRVEILKAYKVINEDGTINNGEDK